MPEAYENGPYVRKDVFSAHLASIDRQLSAVSKDISDAVTSQQNFATRHEEQHRALSRVVIGAVLSAAFSLVVTLVVMVLNTARAG